MGIEGSFRYNTLDMSWEPKRHSESYSVVVEKCDEIGKFGNDICQQIFSKIVKNTTALIQTSEKFGDCTTYQLKVSITIDKSSKIFTHFICHINNSS